MYEDHELNTRISISPKSSTLTLSKDFQLYTLDVKQDRKCYSKALKMKVELYPSSKGTQILTGFEKYCRTLKVACVLGAKPVLRTWSRK